MEAIILQLFQIFTPVVQAAIAKHRSEHGTDPTDAQIVAIFQANTDEILAAGAAWKAAHPA